VLGGAKGGAGGEGGGEIGWADGGEIGEEGGGVVVLLQRGLVWGDKGGRGRAERGEVKGRGKGRASLLFGRPF
jgi:hypothetical protein